MRNHATIPFPSQIIEVYEYYDKPLLFSCKNTLNQIFLAVIINDTEDKEIWYYVQMSPLRFEKVKGGNIDLHDAFSQSENGKLLKITIQKSQNIDVTIELVSTNEINDNDLPLIGSTLIC